MSGAEKITLFFSSYMYRECRVRLFCVVMGRGLCILALSPSAGTSSGHTGRVIDWLHSPFTEPVCLMRNQSTSPLPINPLAHSHLHLAHYMWLRFLRLREMCWHMPVKCCQRSNCILEAGKKLHNKSIYLLVLKCLIKSCNTGYVFHCMYNVKLLQTKDT